MITLYTPTATDLNRGRAQSGRRALEAFRAPLGPLDDQSAQCPTPDVLRDLLVNLRLLADEERICWDTLLQAVDSDHSNALTAELDELQH